MMQPVMEARGLTKRYGQVTALDGADFELLPGEVLAVIGDNGAGKSTLIKALTGAIVPDEGEIKLDGRVVHFRTPIDARRAGIETVYQDLAVAPALDIATNLFLGREQRRKGVLGSVFRMLDKPGMRLRWVVSEPDWLLICPFAKTLASCGSGMRGQWRTLPVSICTKGAPEVG